MSVISSRGEDNKTVIAINAVQELVSKMNMIPLSKEQPTCWSSFQGTFITYFEYLGTGSKELAPACT
jgi:hypothetical protein